MTHTMTKAAQVVVKAVGPTDPDQKADDGTGLGPGEFRAVVSVFGNVDSYGDEVMAGAFADVLADYATRGAPIPVVWSHAWADVFAHIGHVEPGNAKETDEGLEVIGKLDVDSPVPQAAAFAQQVHRLLAQKRISQFSFAFDVAEAGWGLRGTGDQQREVFELRKFAALHEVGPCLVGVNRDTRLDDVKAVRADFPKPDRKAEDAPPTPDEPTTPEPDGDTTDDPAPTDPPAPPQGDGDDDNATTDPGNAPEAKAASLDPRSAALLADIAALG
ncbi:HK97 family phage prohead protease [Nocardioides sp. STR2]|uniref:HK97 family phage prohead protease n=1 Tax=Nocardioides pini TaxID=2975053 RepID=A0ABT4CCM0_9ACTN|nr:HK97 family phage prohead protease [Nocardioides pini]MCY4726705.1 HK97 family phage prohead protease [Nocardioides pini]